ncbi:MAG: hypothetical protein AAFV38_02080 [Pseudomonadota bacterium]
MGIDWVRFEMGAGQLQHDAGIGLLQLCILSGKGQHPARVTDFDQIGQQLDANIAAVCRLGIKILGHVQDQIEPSGLFVGLKRNVSEPGIFAVEAAEFLCQGRRRIGVAELQRRAQKDERFTRRNMILKVWKPAIDIFKVAARPRPIAHGQRIVQPLCMFEHTAGMPVQNVR